MDVAGSEHLRRAKDAPAALMPGPFNSRGLAVKSVRGELAEPPTDGPSPGSGPTGWLQLKHPGFDADDAVYPQRFAVKLRIIALPGYV